MIEGAPPQASERAAQHCEELLSNTLEPADIAGDFARFGTRLTQAIQPLLARLFDAPKLEVELVECTACSATELGETLGERRHHARFALGSKGLGILASANVGALIGEFDRMLGGDGEGPAEANHLPASANRFAREIEAELLAASIEACGRGDMCAAERGSDFNETVPASARAANGAGVHIATVAVTRPGIPKLTITFATCEATFVQFAGETPVGKPVRRSIGELPLEESAIAGVELPTTATLVDMAIPLHRIVSLQVGTLLPVSIHRSIPLSIADTTIAHGTVGALDDRVALEIHHTAFAKDT